MCGSFRRLSVAVVSTAVPVCEKQQARFFVGSVYSSQQKSAGSKYYRRCGTIQLSIIAFVSCTK